MVQVAEANDHWKNQVAQLESNVPSASLVKSVKPSSVLPNHQPSPTNSPLPKASGKPRTSQQMVQTRKSQQFLTQMALQAISRCQSYRSRSTKR